MRLDCRRNYVDYVTGLIKTTRDPLKHHPSYVPAIYMYLQCMLYPIPYVDAMDETKRDELAATHDKLHEESIRANDNGDLTIHPIYTDGTAIRNINNVIKKLRRGKYTNVYNTNVPMTGACMFCEDLDSEVVCKKCKYPVCVPCSKNLSRKCPLCLTDDAMFDDVVIDRPTADTTVTDDNEPRICSTSMYQTIVNVMKSVSCIDNYQYDHNCDQVLIVLDSDDKCRRRNLIYLIEKHIFGDDGNECVVGESIGNLTGEEITGNKSRRMLRSRAVIIDSKTMCQLTTTDLTSVKHVFLFSNRNSKKFEKLLTARPDIQIFSRHNR